MLTTTLAIRAVLALLLSAASFTALLRDPAAAVPAPASAQERSDIAPPPAYRTAVEAGTAYAVIDAPVSAGRICR
ncbi:hypothetical protein M2650_13805 [Luteimonas sp. SX5]|uniref:Uncharacterized protein n=1 Tax=Luteimonas galliterrae TaxID=2940486 RepID=A0ABT0MLD9_9GAMM|nr:hypothetical protein [Luteimonas galliterrae]MCL1635699.1 hypothetical protein [Luteimonas galliterrae]